MRSPYKQIFKFEDQRCNLMKILVFRGKNDDFGKIRLIPKKRPQGQLWRKDVNAQKPMHKYCLCKLFH